MQWFDKKLRSRTLFNLDFVVNTIARCALRSYKCGCWGTENRSIKWLSRKSEYIGLCPEGIAGGGDRERQAFQDEAAFARILRNACWCHQEHHQPQYLKKKNGFLLFTAQIIICERQRTPQSARWETSYLCLIFLMQTKTMMLKWSWMWLRKQDHPTCWGCHDPMCNWLRQSVIRMIFVAASLSQKVALAAMLRNATSNSQKGCRRAEYQICIIAFGILVFLHSCILFCNFCIFLWFFQFLYLCCQQQAWGGELNQSLQMRFCP